MGDERLLAVSGSGEKGLCPTIHVRVYGHSTGGRGPGTAYLYLDRALHVLTTQGNGTWKMRRIKASEMA